MPADIATTNGRTAMMYAGATPWHRLGKRLDAPATAAEAITAAGLDYSVELQSIKTEADLRVPRRKAVVRTDTKTVLGVVSRGYAPIQNKTCFDFLDSVVAENGLRYHTAGALGRGERIWMLAKLPSHIRVKNSDDITEKFLLLSNSHDGSSALRCFLTPIRVVCANTLTLAHRQHRGEGITIRHRGNLAAKVREARDALGLAQVFFDDLEGRIDRLASHSPTPAQLQVYFKTLFPDPEERRATRAENVRERLTELFESGMGQDIPQIRHTSWAAFNAVSEYVDHVKPTRGRDDDDRTSKRLESSLFGMGANLKARAFDLALAMAAGEPMLLVAA
jgi:phage/plasmid-like protein (TIGR03299 family)